MNFKPNKRLLAMSSFIFADASFYRLAALPPLSRRLAAATAAAAVAALSPRHGRRVIPHCRL